MKYKLLGSDVKFSGHVLRLKVDEIELPSGKKTSREVIEHGGAVGMIPIHADGSIVLVEQYRHAVDKNLLEIPAGKRDVDGEEPVETARRELQEEVGLTASEYIELARFYTTPGYSNEFFYLYLVRGLVPAGAAGEVEEEITSVATVTFGQALQMIADGRIEDGKTIAAIAMAKLYLDEHG